MDISVKTIEIDRRGKEGLICKDNIRADIKVTFFVRVNKTVEDVLKVAQSIGCCARVDQKTIEHLFTAKFSEALKTVGKRSTSRTSTRSARSSRTTDHRGHRQGPERLRPRRRAPSTTSSRRRIERSTSTTSWTRRASGRSPTSRP
jgi:hypothetical protein